ncbi:carboxymethylenebutenolidase [Crossiella equi]|uniref:Carboxymethylenebutenolidase n=1 Tax=Crossiella equi TaxID=130796 RepID=A0ABS5AAR6_9PSEU|nr:dienelactone hydrolase family protein [Crossiella equi]MBP2473677.1 carboxymethylenebutenolidase [Crossiella equi]
MTEPVIVPVRVADGEFDLTVWRPESGQGPAILLVQEIFGVGPYIQAVARELAALGYVVGAPDLFWRLTRNWAADHDEAGLTASMELAGRFDFETGVADAQAATEVLRGLDGVRGGVGALGFCLGGSITWVQAAQGGPDAVVSFYGSGVPDASGLAEAITVPTLLHFGGSDPYIQRADIARVEAAVAGRELLELHVQEDAGHAFHNHQAPAFHQPEAAARAWRLTEEFLGRVLPVS